MAKKVEDHGEPLQHDPDFRGPLKRRSCTDVICLLFFLLFIATWIGIGLYAIINGDPSTLLVPKDTRGQRCGKDSGVEDKPYLLFQDITKCVRPTIPFTRCDTEQVCVKKCPDVFYVYPVDHSSLNESITQFCAKYEGVDTCPPWLLPSKSFLNRCLPDEAARKKLIDLGLLKVQENDDYAKNDTTNPVRWTSTVVQKILAVLDIENLSQVGQYVVEDIKNSWYKIFIGVILTLLVCILYILMLRWTAAVMVWVSICGVVVALAAALYFTVLKYIEYRDKLKGRVFDGDRDELTTHRDLWLALVVILSIALLVILLMLIFLRKRIILAIALIKEGSKAVSSVTASLFFPILPWVLQVGVIAYSIAVAVYLASIGKPLYKADVTRGCENQSGILLNSVCDKTNFAAVTKNLTECQEASCRFVKMQNDVLYPYLQAYNVFGFFWLAFFVSALGQMVLASVFAQWYWTFEKRRLPFFAVTSAFLRTLRYHIGTLAFGSLIIAICRIIRVILEYLDQKLKKYDNEFTKAIMCLLKCFFYCLEKFLKFINKNAYIMCAVHGKNFCTSAKDAFMLLMRNIIRVYVLDKVTDFLFFLSKVLLTLGVGAVSYVLFATDLVPKFIDNSNMHYGIVPVVIIMICTYLISSLFFGVYSMAVDTLFLCFLEDCERNDGSAEKPYFMSKSLMKIFGKKNKRE
ncbi:choline transporter-like 2 isoform X2 [Leptinotarsa decemlineata]